MDYIIIYVQAAVALMCFIMPGLAVLRKMTRDAVLTWPTAFAMAPAFLISSLILIAYQSLSLALLPVLAARLATWILLVVILLHTVGGGWRSVLDLMRKHSPWERRMWLLLLGLLAVWLGLMPLSPYPAQISMGLGDRPGYYRLAANLVSGRGWLVDFFIGDYIGGKPSYLTNHPLPVLVTTFLFQVVGRNAHSLSVYCVLAAALHVALLCSFVCTVGRKAFSDARIFVAAVAALAIPIHFHLLGIGVSTVPGALAFMTATVFLVEHVDRPLRRFIMCAVAILFLIVVRPEAALLGVLLLVCFPVVSVLIGPGVRRRWRVLLLTMCAAAIVGLWVKLPGVVARLPANLRNLSVFYLKYEPERKEFGWMYAPWWKINEMLCAANFSSDGAAVPEINDAIGEEIRNHPGSLVLFLLDSFSTTTAKLLGTVTIDCYLKPSPIAQGLVGLMLIFSFIAPRNRVALVVILIQLFILPLVNVGFGGRHLLPVTAVLYALFGRAMLSRPGWMAKRFCIALAVVCIASNMIDLVAVRRDDVNRAHTGIVAALRQMVQPGDLVASSYPQLIANEVDCRTTGCTWLADNLDAIIAHSAPDIIVVDNSRDGPSNYTLLNKRRNMRLDGYRLVIHDKEERYAVFVSHDRLSRGIPNLSERR